VEEITCPRCGSSGAGVVPILYGLPGEELFAGSVAGEVELGGCCVGPRDPEWHCKACGHDWRVSEPGYPRRRPL
jgi:transposase-like protein